MEKLPLSKRRRQEKLLAYLNENPFATDRELAEHFSVSVQTIRLDRLALDIPQVRERVKNMAQNAYAKVKSLEAKEVVGELIDLRLNQNGISLLEIDETMVLEKKQIARGHYLFAQANSLAVALIDAPVVLTGSARVRYKRPVKLGERVIAKGVVKVQRGNTYLISVYSSVGKDLVFRGQFIVTVPKQGVDDN
ncbi:MAG: transcription factor FapR [Clostridia bacterium]|nr:transcription factor FapR [Clostridia bacterium]